MVRIVINQAVSVVMLYAVANFSTIEVKPENVWLILSLWSIVTILINYIIDKSKIEINIDRSEAKKYENKI